MLTGCLGNCLKLSETCDGLLNGFLSCMKFAIIFLSNICFLIFQKL